MILTAFARIRAVLLAAGLGLAFSACDDTAVSTDAPVALQVVPAGPLQLVVGDTVRLDVVLRNAPEAGASVSFSSSAPEVADVSSTGTVRAVREGTATVTIRASAYPEAFATVLVRVAAAQDDPPTPSALSITSILQPNGSFADPSAIRGTIVVRVGANHPAAVRVEVLVDSVLACSEPLSGGGPVQLACPIDTARFDSATAAPTFRNGTRTLRARLLGPADTVLARVQGVQLIFANPNRLAVSVAGARAARDSAGREWIAGDVTVTALPVVYDPGVTVAAVRARYGERQVIVADTTAPFAPTIPAAALDGVTDADFELSVTSTTTGGDQGPVVDSTAALRYDSRPPAPGSFQLRDWVGRDVAFAGLYAGGDRDEGVGGVSVRFFAGAPAQTPEQLVASGTEVRTGGDLAASGAGAYRVAARACDALENCRTLEGFTFGVDLDAPVVSDAAGSALLVNRSAPLEFAVRDEVSGLEARPLEVSVQVLDRDEGTPACGPVVGGVDLPGRVVGGSCVPDTLGTIVPVPTSGAGYFRYSIVPLDRAGNRGATVRRDLLRDVSAPTVPTVTAPAPFVGGAAGIVTATAADNLDLAELSFLFVFPGVPGVGTLALPFSAPIELSTAGDDVLRVSASAADTVLLPRSLTSGATVGSRTTVLVSAVEARATDQAGQVGTGSVAVPPASLSSTGTADPFPEVATVAMSASTPLLCTAGCLPTDLTRSVLTYRLVGESGFQVPISRAYFYLRDAAGTVTFLGSATFSAADVGAERTATYQLTYAPTEPANGDFTVFAVGRGERGNLLKSPDLTFRLFAR